LARDLGNPIAKAGLAEAWFNQGRLAEALELWQELVDTHPQLPGVFTGLGQTYLWLSDIESARQAFTDQQQHHFDPQAQWFLAALQAPVDVVTAADMLHSISTGRNPADDVPAEVLTQRDYLLDVLSPFTVDSSQVDVAKATGIALAQIGLWPLASYALEIANERSDDADGETLSFLGYALAQSGRPALNIFEQAQQADPDSAWPMYFQGLYLRDQQAFNAAEAMFREALALDPDNAAIYVELGRTRAQQGDLGTAEAAFLTAVEVAQKDSQSPVLWVQKVLARFYADRGYRIAEAGIPAAEALLEIDENAEAQALLGWMQFLAGHPVEAETSLRQALGLDPELVEARYYLARLFETQGQTESALAEYERVVDWDTSGELRKLAFEGRRRLGVE
jgi:tetratricopeptide (TPR) repeat protein